MSPWYLGEIDEQVVAVSDDKEDNNQQSIRGQHERNEILPR